MQKQLLMGSKYRVITTALLKREKAEIITISINNWLAKQPSNTPFWTDYKPQSSGH